MQVINRENEVKAAKNKEAKKKATGATGALWASVVVLGLCVCALGYQVWSLGSWVDHQQKLIDRRVILEQAKRELVNNEATRQLVAEAKAEQLKRLKVAAKLQEEQRKKLKALAAPEKEEAE